jgi:hypothetical protein
VKDLEALNKEKAAGIEGYGKIEIVEDSRT